MPLDIKIKTGASKKAIVVALTGSLDTATAPELEKQLTPAIGKAVNDVVFDLVEEMDRYLATRQRAVLENKPLTED
jgi:anti-anti-sigma regulatory factor